MWDSVWESFEFGFIATAQSVGCEDSCTIDERGKSDNTVIQWTTGAIRPTD